MSTQAPSMMQPYSETNGNRRREWYAPEQGRAYGTRSSRSSSHGPALRIAALVVLGLGVLGWAYLGKDIMRYLKIQNM